MWQHLWQSGAIDQSQLRDHTLAPTTPGLTKYKAQHSDHDPWICRGSASHGPTYLVSSTIMDIVVVVVVVVVVKIYSLSSSLWVRT